MMEQLPEDDIVEAPALSVGRQLREGRERLGLSIEDVVSKIKLAPRQIIALEQDDFNALPQTAFLRGFVRSYAKLLQLEADPLINALPGAVVAQVETPKVEAPLPSEKTVRQQNLNLLIASLLVAVVIAGFAVWQANSPRVPETVVADVAASDVMSVPLTLPSQAENLDNSEAVASGVVSATPAVSAVAAVSSVAAASSVLPTIAKSPATLRLVFDRESWAEIKDQSGKTLSRQVNLPGSELRLEGIAPFTMVIGHAAAVHLYYREKPVDLSSYINASSDVARMTLE